MMLLAISRLLPATAVQAALIGVREFSRRGGSFFDATDMFSESMLPITTDNVFVQSPIGAAAEAVLTDGSPDTFSVLFSQCSNAASPEAGLCVGGGGGSGQQVAWSYDAAIRIHGDAVVAPIPEPHAALVFAIGLAAASRAARRR
jgi:hypothetical protein